MSHCSDSKWLQLSQRSARWYIWVLWLQVPCCSCVASVWPFSTESCSMSSHAPITNWLECVQIHHQLALQYPQPSISQSVFSSVSHFLFIPKTLHLSLCLLTSYKPLLSASSLCVSSSSLSLSKDRLHCFALRRRTLSDSYKRSIL